MAATVTKDWDNVSPYQQLGKSTNIGAFYLRKVSIEYTAGTTTASVTASDLGGQEIAEILSLTPTSNITTWVSSSGTSAYDLDVSGNGTIEAIFLVKGV